MVQVYLVRWYYNKLSHVTIIQESPEFRLSSWFGLHSNWSNLVLSALCYLGCEVGGMNVYIIIFGEKNT